MRADRWKLIALCMGTFMLLLDITIVQAALPTIQRKLGGGLTALQWTVDAYTVPLAALILTLGTVADRFGRRLVFVVGVVVFSAASVACGLAQSTSELDVWRAVQGVGGAAMFATALALVGQEFGGAARGRAILVWSSTVGAAVALGPLLGGLLTEYASWRWIFFVNAPIGALVVALTLWRVGERRDSSGRRLDGYGVVTLSGGLALTIAGLLHGSEVDWAGSAAPALIGAGLCLLIAFAVLQRRPGAMLESDLVRDPSVAGVSLATATLGAGMFAAILFLTVYLQGALGLSPVAAGVRLLPLTLPVFVVPFVLRRLQIAPASGRLVATGLGVIAAGLLLMVWVSASASWLHLLPGLVVAGVGIGIANAAVAATGLAVVAPNRMGLAAGLSNSCRIGGIAVGIALLGAVFRVGIASALPNRTSGSARDGIAAGHIREAGMSLAHAAGAFDAGLRAVLVTAAVIIGVGVLVAARYVRVGGASQRQQQQAPALVSAETL